MANIKIIMSSGPHFGSAFLRWYTHCPYSHCEMLFEDEQGAPYIIGARVAGVKKFSTLSVPNRSTILEMEVTDEQYEKFHAFVHGKVGASYDWRAYLGFLFNKKTEGPNRWFCSELIAAAFNHAGIEMFHNTGTWYITPRDIYISASLKEV